jgi:putative addiction module killer protein
MSEREIELRRYRTEKGSVPFSEWLDQLDPSSAGRVLAYVDRMKTGNFGNSRPVGGGVLELKIDFGPGYRVYYVRDGRAIVLLLCGGNKDSQWVDIGRAREFFADYLVRK